MFRRNGSDMSRIELHNVALLLFALVLVACSSGSDNEPSNVEEGSAQQPSTVALSPEPEATEDDWEDTTLMVYSALDQRIAEPLFARFTDETGIEIDTWYDQTGALFNMIIMWFSDTECDVLITDNTVHMYLMANDQSYTIPIPLETAQQVRDEFREPWDRWVGIAGRMVGFAWRTDRIDPGELPQQLSDVTEPAWVGRVGWAPSDQNALWLLVIERALNGDGMMLELVRGMLALEPREFETDAEVLDALVRGEIDLALATHVQVAELRELWGDDIPIGFHRIDDGGASSQVLTWSVGVIQQTDQPRAGMRLVEFLVSPEVQTILAEQAGLVSTTWAGPEPVGLPARDELLQPPFDRGSVRPHVEALEAIRSLQRSAIATP